MPRHRRLLQAVVGLAAIAALLLTDQIVVDRGGRPTGAARAADAPTVTATPSASATAVTTIPAGDRVASYGYAGTGDAHQRLIATWRPGPTGRPWIAMIHGGSWYKGSPAELEPAVGIFSAHGYPVFNLEYRLVSATADSRSVTWLDQRHDILTALRWIRAHAAAFGIDPDRGALLGNSAGGNLALAAGLAGDGGNGIRAIVSVSGVVQPSALWDTAGLRLDRALPLSARRLAGHARNAAGCPFGSRSLPACRAIWRNMDVINAVSPHDPAVMMFQGLADRTVLPQMARAFRSQLNRRNIGGSLTLVPGLGHDQRVALDGGARQAAMLAFVRQRTSVASAPALARLRITQQVRGARRVTVRAQVRPTDPTRVTGRVTVAVGGRILRRTLSRGVVTVTVPRGSGRLTVRYGGSATIQPRSAVVTVRG